MASQLLLTNLPSQVNPVVGAYSSSLARQSFGLVYAVVRTVSGSSGLAMTDSIGGPVATWDFQVGAGTISGNVSANIWGYEANASANAGFGIQIDQYASDGTTLVRNLLSQKPIPATITELTTGLTAKVLAATALTNTGACSNGDIIRVRFFVLPAGGTMGSNYSVNLAYNGDTSGASGDTYVTFANTLPAYVPVQVKPPTRPRISYNFDEGSGTTFAEANGNTWANGALVGGPSLVG